MRFVLASMFATVALLSTRADAVARTFTVVAGEVRFEIDAPLDTINGVTRGVGGAVIIDPAAWTTKPAGRVVVDLTSFRTGIDLRDEDLRDQFFESSKFGTAQLNLTSLDRPSVAKLETGTTAEVIITGTLDLHGITRDVSIPAKVTFDEGPNGARVKISGDFVVPLEEHGMKRPKRLLFKLGKDVRVHINATLRAPPEAKPTDAIVAGADDALPPLSPLVNALPPPPKPPPPPAFKFAASTAEGRGERAFADAKIGGAKNQMKCRSCHAEKDERNGIKAGAHVPASSSVWGVGKRSLLWQGLAATPGAAATICAKLFMLRPEGLDVKVEADLDAYLKAISPDVTPPHWYGNLHLTRKTPVAEKDTAGKPGNIANGKKLTELYCAGCHKKGSVRPALEPGLYEREMIVWRVRRFPGADNVQMPPITLDRLPDSELRDIAAYLSDEKQRIFIRKKPSVPAPAAPAPK